MAGQVLDANDKFLEMIGYQSADFIAGRIDLQNMTPEEFRPLDELSVAELQSVRVNAAPFEKKLGYLRWMSTTRGADRGLDHVPSSPSGCPVTALVQARLSKRDCQGASSGKSTSTMPNSIRGRTSRAT